MSRVTDSLTRLEKAYVSLRLTAVTRPFISRPAHCRWSRLVLPRLDVHPGRRDLPVHRLLLRVLLGQAGAEVFLDADVLQARAEVGVVAEADDQGNSASAVVSKRPVVYRSWTPRASATARWSSSR